MILIAAIKPIVKRNSKIVIFTRLFREGELRAYKVNPVLFLYALGLLAVTKNIIQKKGE